MLLLTGLVSTRALRFLFSIIILETRGMIMHLGIKIIILRFYRVMKTLAKLNVP